MNFGSDNQTGASDQVIRTLLAANEGIQPAYGDDEWTQQACQLINQVFECDADVFFVSTGTAANCLALSSITPPWGGILCHGQAHIINDELTAPEFFTQGARLIPLDSHHAKLSAHTLATYLEKGATHPPHNVEPACLSLTQLNEAGQIYSVDELKVLTAIAQQHSLFTHMDGARFANALCALDCAPADITWRAGIDVLCLGATKNGALAAEAVIFFNRTLAQGFIQQRKRSGHLVSKSRWLGAQFVGWLQNDHWLTLANYANEMGQYLANALTQQANIELTWPAVANEVFAHLPKGACKSLRDQGAVFYPWPSTFLPNNTSDNDDLELVRFVTSFATHTTEIDTFIALLKKELRSTPAIAN